MSATTKRAQANPFYSLGFERDLMIDAGELSAEGGRVIPNTKLLYRMNHRKDLLLLNEGGDPARHSIERMRHMWDLQDGTGHLGAVDPFQYMIRRINVSADAHKDVFRAAVTPGDRRGAAVSRLDDEPVPTAFFFVLNGPDFFKSAPVAHISEGVVRLSDPSDGPPSEQSATTMDCLQLQHGQWVIDMVATADNSQSKDAAIVADGRCATHCGEVRRADGDDFTLRDLQSDRVMDDLFWFLSFVRGAYCGIPIVCGGHDLTACPLLADNPRSSRGFPPDGWYDSGRVGKDELAQLFESFSYLMFDQDFFRSVSACIETNSASVVVESKIAMSFAEMLAVSESRGQIHEQILWAISQVWPGGELGEWEQMPLPRKVSQDASSQSLHRELGIIRSNLAHSHTVWDGGQISRVSGGWSERTSMDLVHVHQFLVQWQELRLLKRLGYSGLCRMRDTGRGKPTYLPVPSASTG